MDPNIMRYKTTVLNEMKIELANRRNPKFNTTKLERKAMRRTTILGYLHIQRRPTTEDQSVPQTSRQ